MKSIVQKLNQNNKNTRADIDTALEKMSKENKQIDKKAIEISALKTVLGSKQDSLLSSDGTLDDDVIMKRVTSRNIIFYSVICAIMFSLMAGLLYYMTTKN